MLLFPQLQSGALAQFPLVKSYAISNVTNLQEDGSRYRSGGTNPTELNWTLAFAHLTQPEADTLSLFFETTMGRLLSFTFLDPLNNLLSWSEDLTQSVWDKSPLTSIVLAQTDGYNTVEIRKSGAGSARVSQILQCPAVALLCFSLYARAGQSTSLTITIDDVEQVFNLGNTWKQYSITQSGAGSIGTKTITVSMESGQVEISRLMVCPQPAPSSYTITQAISGVMTRTRFDQDSLSFTATDKGNFSCEVRLISRLT